jgi:hypothetical protein
MAYFRSWGLFVPALLCSCSAETEAVQDVPARSVVDDLAVRARMSACLGTPFLFTVRAFKSTPFVDLPGDPEGCVAAAPDCAHVLTCLRLDRPCSGENHCEHAGATLCERLPNGIEHETLDDCAGDEANPICSVVDTGTGTFAVCNSGRCDAESCDGDVAVRCIGGVQVRIPCDSATHCVNGTTGVFCAKPQSCTRDHCEGNSATVCRDGSVEVEQDCGEFVADGVCRDEHGIVECRSRVSHLGCPDDEPFTDGCDGSDGFACYEGARYEIACSLFAGGHCVTDNSGQSHCSIDP